MARIGTLQARLGGFGLALALAAQGVLAQETAPAADPTAPKAATATASVDEKPAAAAASVDLPAHSVSFDAGRALCRIVLEPADATGTAPPRLFLSYDMMKPSLSFGLQGDDITEAVLIRQGVRHPFVAQEGLTLTALQKDPIWSEIAAGPATSESLYLTIKDTQGAYSSARYDTLSQEGILRLAGLACGVEGLTVEARTPVEHRAAEARLGLSDADRLHLRRVLAARYGEAGADPGTGTSFTVTDRRFIAQMNTEEGYPSGEYLWPASVSAILAEAVKEPAPNPTVADGEAELSRFDDWVVLGDAAKGACRVVTMATVSEGVDPGLRMQFAITRAGSGGMMAIDLVTPNPFRGDMPLAAVIDGQGFPLAVEPVSGAVIPQLQPDGSLSRDLFLALRHGKAVTIQGISAKTNAPARLDFSAMGFVSAFKAMATACDRAPVMGWIN